MLSCPRRRSCWKPRRIQRKLLQDQRLHFPAFPVSPDQSSIIRALWLHYRSGHVRQAVTSDRPQSNCLTLATLKRSRQTEHIPGGPVPAWATRLAGVRLGGKMLPARPIVGPYQSGPPGCRRIKNSSCDQQILAPPTLIHLRDHHQPNCTILATPCCPSCCLFRYLNRTVHNSAAAVTSRWKGASPTAACTCIDGQPQLPRSVSRLRLPMAISPYKLPDGRARIERCNGAASRGDSASTEAWLEVWLLVRPSGTPLHQPLSIAFSRAWSGVIPPSV